MVLNSITNDNLNAVGKLPTLTMGFMKYDLLHS